MKKPEGYVEVNCHPEDFFLGSHGWLSYWYDSSGPTPACVPYLHRGFKAKIHEVHHRMDHACSCPENFDKPVRCLITMLDSTQYYGTHLPGQCPGLKYRPRRRQSKKEK